MRLRRCLSKIWMLLPLMTISGCSWWQKTVVVSNECSWYEDFKISCNKEKLPAGTKCSDVIAENPKELHGQNTLMFQQKCR